MKKRALQIKKWLLNEKSQVTNESGMHNLFVIMLIIGLCALLYPQLNKIFTRIMSSFITAGKGSSNEIIKEPLGKSSDWSL
ncbi:MULTISPECIES: hypothetical protein [Bacillus cereus group]|uniref:Uncharacterized protein n=1 Tax=Bacillus cereus 03BB108 TaxID=451709 RepID=A0AAN0W4L2_BACCE|nr:hypothetical protein [Bacillus cereus]AJI08919.1 hypothetical protein AK40_5560 [Bacillus cereus 03BB108]EDX59854.1 conserved hypothetical protein [Bacillus cereus 03BB108]QKG99049.1 hypothetical protein FOC96_02010 [Bacillus cereus]HDR7252894.1 hypothetical protein [Bacillus pacificus]